ncbi:hypothetical protein EON80_25255 [bacterium]|nr:MAG: hypothetical protein EON80_25255 [bacterium]
MKYSSTALSRPTLALASGLAGAPAPRSLRDSPALAFLHPASPQKTPGRKSEYGYPDLADWTQSVDLRFIRDLSPVTPSGGAWDEKHFPFELDPFDAEVLQKMGMLTPQAVAARGYFSVPHSPAGENWLLALGCSEEQIAKCRWIAAPVRNHRGEIQRFSLLPTRPLLDERGRKVEIEMPANGSNAEMLDVSPMSYASLDNGSKTVVHTNSPLYADSAASRGMVGVATPLQTMELSVINRLVNGDYAKILGIGCNRNHLFVFNAGGDGLDAFSVNALHLMQILFDRGEKIHVVKLQAELTGAPGTLGSFFEFRRTEADLLKLAVPVE